MKFGPVPVALAEGALLAHSVRLAGQVLKKGKVLTADDIAALAGEDVTEVTVAQLEQGDLGEDEAAARIAAALAPETGIQGAEAQEISVTAPFTGRVNLHATRLGVMVLDTAAIAHANQIDEAITVATLPDFSRVSPRQLLATVKIIPYAVNERAVAAVEMALTGTAAIDVRPVVRPSASLILTRTPGMPDKLANKGADAVVQRLTALGIDLAARHEVAHETRALADAVVIAKGEIVLILTASATSDRQDVGPAALIAAGGTLERFGMPVDPGNLLFLGELAGRPVIGLPGCARSPKLNGADWVLERIACGIDVTTDQIAAMAVGGLLKEIPSRPQPRSGGPSVPKRPKVSALVLAAGQSRRMGGRDKLMEQVMGRPLLRHAVEAVSASAIDEVVAVLPPDAPDRTAALEGSGARIVLNPRAEEGMGRSISAGMAELGPDPDAVMVVLADMPDLSAADYDRLIAAFDPEEGRAIVRAVTASGKPGHPVLFARRFFELLAGLEGDYGARGVVEDHRDYLADVSVTGNAAEVDLDTPEDWAAWRAASDRPSSG